MADVTKEKDVTTGLEDRLSVSDAHDDASTNAGVEDRLVVSDAHDDETVKAGISDHLFYGLQDDGLPVEWGDVTPTGTQPRISSIKAGTEDNISGSFDNILGSVVRVTFDSLMRFHPTLGGVLTPSNYVIREGSLAAPGRRLNVHVVRKRSDQVVDIYTEEFPTPEIGDYSIEIRNVESEDGDIIDPLYNDGDFTATGTSYFSGDTMHSFYGLEAGFQSDSATGVDPDTTAPTLQNQNPAPSTGGIDIASNVYLETVDVGQGINKGATVIQVNGVTAWQNQAQQNGFIVAETPVVNGWAYDIDPPSDFAEGAAQSVRVYAQDVAPLPNTLDTTYTFSTGFVDVVGPQLENRIPSPGSTLPVDANILFDITDDKTGIDNAQTKVWIGVQGEALTLAWESDGPTAGFAGTRTPIAGLPYPKKGERFVINPDADFLPSRIIEVRVQTQDFGGPPNTLDSTYSLFSTPDVEAPYLVNQDPSPETIDVEATRGVRFTIADDFAVQQSSIQVWIRGALAYHQGSWKNGFTGLVAANVLLNGFDFIIKPPTPWLDDERIVVRIIADDTVPNAMDSTYYFGGPQGTEQPFSTYRMMMRAIRQHDEQSPGLLSVLCEDGFDDVWKRTMFDPSSNLPTLFEPDNVDAKWLPWLKSLVGLTRDLHFQATEEELRRVISGAVPMWNNKPSEPGIEDAIRMVTGNRFSARDFFSLRMEGDVVRITEELENFDPNVLLFSWDNFIEGLKVQTCVATSSYPCTHTFIINDDLPVFTSQHQYTHLLVLPGHPGGLDGLYEIDHLDVGALTGVTKDPLVQTSDEGSFKLLNPNSDMTTEIRIADRGVALLPFREEDNVFSAGIGGETIHGDSSGAKASVIDVSYDASGRGSYLLWNVIGRFEINEHLTGSISGDAVCNGIIEKASWSGESFAPINRDLLGFLISQVRASSERLDVVYVSFIEQFLEPQNIEQWEAAPAVHGITVPDPGGEALIPAGSSMFVDGQQADYWGERIATFKVQGPATSVAYLNALGDSAGNGYRVQVDFTAQTVKLMKNGSDLTSPIHLPAAIVPDVNVTIRVDVIFIGSSSLVRVRVDGDYVIEYTDPVGLQAGKIGIEAAGATISVRYVEMNELPTEIQRIGPTP